MNRKLLVTLLHKNIEELNVITDGFMEMEQFPAAILYLAKRKTEDIQTIIEQLDAIQSTGIIDNKDNLDEKESIITVTPIPETPNESDTDIETNVEIISDELTAINIEELNFPDTSNDAQAQITTEVTVEEYSVTENDNELIIESKESTQLTEESNQHSYKISSEEIKKTTIADKIVNPTVSRNETLAKTENTLSASIAHKKVEDIKQAISIGDRFRFQRELFKGNGEDMNKTLNYINQLATLNEAITFLQSKYGWDTENETTEDFYQIVRRKFL